MDRLRDSLGIVAEAASVSGSDRSSTRSRTSVKAPLDVGRTKKSTRSRVRDLWSTLLHLLKTEWPTIKSLNLGAGGGCLAQATGQAQPAAPGRAS